MARYELRVVDKAGVGTKLGELEEAVIDSIEWVLNGAGSMGFALPVTHAKAALTKLVKREVQVWRDDVLIWWGVPWQRRLDQNQVSVTCLGLWAYFSKRFLHKTLEYDDVEQQTIAWNLIYYAQTAWPGANLNIVSAPFAGSGVTRDYNYRRHEYHNIAQAVHSFTELKNGFDFDIKVFGDGRREWTPYYPRKGVLRPETLAVGHNIIEYEITEDAEVMANMVTYSGSGDGPATIAESYLDEGARDEYQLFQDHISDPDITRRAYLLEKAQEHVRLRARPVAIATATVPYFPIDTGDKILTRISYGEGLLDRNMRLVSMSLSPSDDRLHLTLNPENA